MSKNKTVKIRFLILFSYLTFIEPVFSQFPRRCTDNESIDSVIEPELAYAALNEVIKYFG